MDVLNDISKYKDQLLQLMIENKASDMYLTYWENPSLRVFDKVYKIWQLPILDENQLNQIWYSFMDDIEWEYFRENLDIDLWRSFNWRRFRINISKQQKQIMIVVRLLAWNIPTIDQSWLPEIFKKLISRKSWIILVAGPTWSGKSTTLASMIEEVNSNMEKHIITIEDPIEYVFEAKKSLIEQKQLWSDVHTFSSALKAALRQKPDVILFWEMRDLDSIKNAITLAETWHLVLSTIHSKSSSQTINKIIDSFPSDQQNQIRIQLSDTILAIISQRLAKRKDGNWMVAVHEIMTNNSAVSNLIRENQIKQINNIIQTNRAEGMCLLEENLIDLIEDNTISYDTAISIANNPSYIENEIKSRWIYIE